MHSMIRTILFNRSRAPNNGTELIHAVNISQCHCLHKQVADCSTLNGSGNYRAINRIGNELVEEPVFAAASHNIQRCQCVVP